MIQLHPDYLIFETSGGDHIPCLAETVTIELIGEAANHLDPAIVKEAAAAVVHYFKHEQGREQVSVGEFSTALEKVLSEFGFSVVAGSCSSRQVVESDLVNLTGQADEGFELGFFLKLREEFKLQSRKPADVLAFTGLKPCVKRLAGTKRWCSKCERLSDQIVEFLRECMAVEQGSAKSLVVR
ncbi:MAG: hypothetical protein ACO1QB_16610 [Verrucomicrobiales bacterium]